MIVKRAIFLFFAFLIIGISTGCKSEKTITYPITEKGDQVDDYFGTEVKDPYRWLENESDEKVKEWIKAQNEVTFNYLSKIPFREKIRKRIKEIYNYPKFKSPKKAGEYYFYQLHLAGSPGQHLSPVQFWWLLLGAPLDNPLKQPLPRWQPVAQRRPGQCRWRLRLPWLLCYQR